MNRFSVEVGKEKNQSQNSTELMEYFRFRENSQCDLLCIKYSLAPARAREKKECLHKRIKIVN